MNLLAIGLDYLMLKDDKVRGDVRARQHVYAKEFDAFHLMVYAPKSLGFTRQQWADNLFIYPTNSVKKAFFILDAYRQAAKIIKENKIDVLTVEDPFTCGIVGFLLKKRFKVPLNVQVHIDFCDNEYWIMQRKINTIFNRVAKVILKKADSIRCGTQYEKDKLSSCLGIPKEKINVIPVNSEVRMFQNVDGSDIRSKYLAAKYEQLLLFTGRLVKQKDIPNLLKAFKIILEHKPNTLLLIVGTGTEESYLKSLSEELNLNANICFAGSVAHEEIPQYLAACDIYVVPSIFEGTCIAMTEAMSAAKPVVVTKFAGARDLVEDDKTGGLVEIRDHEALAKKITYLLEHPDEAQQMAIAGQKAIEERFSNNRNIDLVIDLWKRTGQLKKELSKT